MVWPSLQGKVGSRSLKTYTIPVICKSKLLGEIVRKRLRINKVYAQLREIIVISEPHDDGDAVYFLTAQCDRSFAGL